VFQSERAGASSLSSSHLATIIVFDVACRQYVIDIFLQTHESTRRSMRRSNMYANLSCHPRMPICHNIITPSRMRRKRVMQLEIIPCAHGNDDDKLCLSSQCPMNRYRWCQTVMAVEAGTSRAQKSDMTKFWTRQLPNPNSEQELDIFIALSLALHQLHIGRLREVD
jgi:hypothetical protein